MTNDAKVNINARGVGFMGLLTLLFIGLRLADIIQWSWFWVLSPLFLPTLLFLIFLAVMLVMAGGIGKLVQMAKARQQNVE